MLILTLILSVWLTVTVRSWEKTRDKELILGELDCNHCSRVYVPICADNNKTYINECKLVCYNTFFENASLRAKIRNYGPCTLLGYYRRSDIGVLVLPTGHYSKNEMKSVINDRRKDNNDSILPERQIEIVE